MSSSEKNGISSSHCMPEHPELSIIIPAYNEEARLPNTLDTLLQFITDHDLSVEVLVVNDGSTDRTLEQLKSYEPRITILDHRVNMGKGSSVRSGMLNAKGKYRIFMDADLSVPLTFILPMREMLKGGADVVIGSRRTEGAAIVVHQPFLREKLGQLFNLFVRILGLSSFKDTQCGFKGFTENAAKKIFTQQLTGRYAFDVEVLFIAQNAGFIVEELGLQWYNSPETKVKAITDPFKMLVDLFIIRAHSFLKRYK